MIIVLAGMLLGAAVFLATLSALFLVASIGSAGRRRETQRMMLMSLVCAVAAGAGMTTGITWIA